MEFRNEESIRILQQVQKTLLNMGALVDIPFKSIFTLQAEERNLIEILQAVNVIEKRISAIQDLSGTDVFEFERALFETEGTGFDTILPYVGVYEAAARLADTSSAQDMVSRFSASDAAFLDWVRAVACGDAPIPYADILTLVALGIYANATTPRHEEVDAPAFVIGDLHGQRMSLLEVLENCSVRSGKPLLATNFVFLGDYGDRGPASVETVAIIVALTLATARNGGRVIMLRGNHDQILPPESINSALAWHEEALVKYPTRCVRDAILCLYHHLPLSCTLVTKHPDMMDQRIYVSHATASARLEEIPESFMKKEAPYDFVMPNCFMNKDISNMKKLLRVLYSGRDAPSIEGFVRAYNEAEDYMSIITETRFFRESDAEYKETIPWLRRDGYVASLHGHDHRYVPTERDDEPVERIHPGIPTFMTTATFGYFGITDTPNTHLIFFDDRARSDPWEHFKFPSVMDPYMHGVDEKFDLIYQEPESVTTESDSGSDSGSGSE